ncbi:hypothetical protein HCJ66_15625 [Listeria sp. FSL L7-1582]|uniref:hypothetical protein n=1 Tax=Listeria portnoyi TaxID=2713504 RepID=UPI00164E47E1|nr:hypothetical protein [Listeria portnoyi]MBC6310966.1 hypothetical protein [Listeria portnoyi]
MNTAGIIGAVVTVIVAVIGGMYTLKSTNKSSESQVEAMYIDKMEVILERYEKQLGELKEEIEALRTEVRTLQKENRHLKSENGKLKKSGVV